MGRRTWMSASRLADGSSAVGVHFAVDSSAYLRFAPRRFNVRSVMLWRNSFTAGTLCCHFQRASSRRTYAERGAGSIAKMSFFSAGFHG